MLISRRKGWFINYTSLSHSCADRSGKPTKERFDHISYLLQSKPCLVFLRHTARHSIMQTPRDEALSLIKKNRILMVSKSWCPDCHYILNIWEKYDIKELVHIIELDKLKDQEHASQLEQEFAILSGEKWVPTIFFNSPETYKTDRHFRDWEKSESTKRELHKLGIDM